MYSTYWYQCFLGETENGNDLKNIYSMMTRKSNPDMGWCYYWISNNSHKERYG